MAEDKKTIDIEVEDEAEEKVEESPEAEQAETETETPQAAPTEAKADDEDLNTKYLRLAADFQNYRRRVEAEKSDIYQFANEKIVSELINVIDNFDRAMAQADAEDSFAQGMTMILKQLNDVLAKSGVEEIEALGQPFDPNFHHAVMTEDTEEFESGTVSGVLQKGYTLNKRVVRPAMVKVAN